jgi:hypothetical protein
VGLVAVNAPHGFTASTRAMLEDIPRDVVATDDAVLAELEESFA